MSAKEFAGQLSSSICVGRGWFREREGGQDGEKGGGGESERESF